MAAVAPRPSPEQEAAVARFLEGGDLKVRAVAGSGKTTTLRLIARETQSRMLYLAFNRSVAEEAKMKFPRHVEVKTLHGLAYGEVVKGNPRYERKLRSSNGQVRPHHVIEALKINNPVLGLAIRITLERFIRSGASEPLPQHIPVEYVTQRALPPERWAEEEAMILRGVKRLWKRMKDEADPFPLSHDGYVRIWAERGAKLNRWEGILVDEAQDLDPVFLGILEAHREQVRRIYVGDPRQQIYGWRGAINAMDRLQAPEVPLTWSFRFSDSLAEVVRGVTGVPHVNRPIEIVGRAAWETEVSNRVPEPPLTILSRTNSGVIRAVLKLEEVHRNRVHVVGGVEELAWLLEDTGDLMYGQPRRNPHPELAGVKNYAELRELEEMSPQIKTLLEILSGYNPYVLAEKLRRIQMRDERQARLVVSTAHKAKGREWDRVVIWDDFFPWWRKENANKEWNPEEENLFYVALTRARKHLCLVGAEDVLSLRKLREGAGILEGYPAGRVTQ